MAFSNLGLSAALLEAVQKTGYAEPTAIQREAIPAALRGQDVLGAAETGSGKTAAFSLPLLQRWMEAGADAKPKRNRAVHALVLVPTRELAAQTGAAIHSLATHAGAQTKVVTVFGGVSINPQMMALRGGADVVVATPGRLLDLLAQNALKIDAVATLVLDEADRLLDLGFADELAQIMKALPPRRQNLFFSATFPAAVEALAKGMLRDPLYIDIAQAVGAAKIARQGQDDGPDATASTDKPAIVQRAISVDAPQRTQLLRHLIQQSEGAWDRVLVFVATRHAADIVSVKLRKAGLEAEPFHGDLSQGKRTQVLADLKAFRIHVVVATDVAARGIDIAQLPVVVNFDLPRSAEDYVHRIGRTGRAGASGLAVSFVSAATEAHFRLIEKRQKISVPREVVAGFEPADIAAEAASDSIPGASSGGIKGSRPSKKDKLRAAIAAAQARASGG
ncbi:MAG: DEAD/DEAH box helicase [Comamonadaceae bacterium]|nr:MAG: DEAD/DEAH box helicase [Comamonadaceae bacterium]